jgi:acyl dehydratase
VRAPTRTWADIAVGDELTPLELPMTATRIVAGAIATRDFMPVHHDRAYANSQGAPDIFMNILATNAYCSRFLTDWAGPDAMIRRLAIRLGVPVFPNSTLQFTGTVTATSPGESEGLVDVAFRAANALGDHVVGTATLAMPLV